MIKVKEIRLHIGRCSPRRLLRKKVMGKMNAMVKVRIRNVRAADLDRLEEIEKKTFSPAEMASRETILKRIGAFPDCFFVAELEGNVTKLGGNVAEPEGNVVGQEGNTVGFINGSTTNRPVICDEMIEDLATAGEDGENMAVFSLNVDPAYQRRGVAAQLMNFYIETARKRGCKTVILTCKIHLVPYYERFGFINCGISRSTHGDAQWFDMKLGLGDADNSLRESLGE